MHLQGGTDKRGQQRPTLYAPSQLLNSSSPPEIFAHLLLVALCVSLFDCNQLYTEAVVTRPEPPETDGFQRTAKQFTNPSNTTSLDPINKRTITICNLFANHRASCMLARTGDATVASLCMPE